jgi:hypothetical protein
MSRKWENPTESGLKKELLINPFVEGARRTIFPRMVLAVNTVVSFSLFPRIPRTEGIIRL